MSKKTTTKTAGQRVPALRIHKQSQRAYGTFSGEVVWFGHRSDPETQARFDAHLAQWLARGRKPEERHDEGLSVRSLVAKWLSHLEDKNDEAWHRNNGDRLTAALKPLLSMHGIEPAREFSPLRLKAVRHAMINSGKVCRPEINSRIKVIRRCFKWAVSEELIPAGVLHGIQSVDAIRPGEFNTHEGRTVLPVSRTIVDATLPYLSGPVTALVELW